MAGEGDSGGGDGGGSADWQHIYDRVEAMVRKSQAQAEALAADCARLQAADRVHRESWEVARRLQRSVEELQAAVREKDAEMDRLRAEAADARKKLQTAAYSKMGWEAAYVELLLGANQKLAELRDSDLEDSRTCAESPNSMEIERYTKLSQDAVHHTSSDLSAELRKLKQSYETMSSKRDKQASALLSEKNSLCSQLDIVQQDYAELLKNKDTEAAQAAGAALKLQKSVDGLKVLVQKKDAEIDRLQAEAVEAKKNHGKDLCGLVSERDFVHNQLSIMQQDHTALLKNKKVLTQKKDHEIVILRAEAVSAEKKVQKMFSLIKEKDDEIQRLKDCHVESVQKYYKDTSETHNKSRSVDPAVTARDKLKNSNVKQTVEEDCKQSERDKGGDEQSTSDEDVDEHSRCDGDDGQSRSDEHDEDEHSQSGSHKERTNNPILKPPENHKRKIGSCNAETANGKRHSENNGMAKRRWLYEPPPIPLCRRKLLTAHGQHSMISTGNWAQFVSDVKDSLADQPDKRKEFDQFLRELKLGYIVSYLASTMKDVLDGQPELIRRFNVFLPNHCQIELEKPDEDGDEQSGSDEGDGDQSGSDEDGDELGTNDEDGDEQGRCDVDGQSRSDGPDNEQHGCDGDDDEQTVNDEETTNNQVQKPLRRVQATSQGHRLHHPPALDVMETSQQVDFQWSFTFDDVPHRQDKK